MEGRFVTLETAIEGKIEGNKQVNVVALIKQSKRFF